MSTLAERLVAAQKKAFAMKPQVGGFPFLAEILRQAGVVRNTWQLPSCQSLYEMKEGSVVQQGETLFKGLSEVPSFDRSALIQALRADQSGKTTFPEFLNATWNAGVIAYEVDFISRTVLYKGINGESYSEDYALVEIT